MIMSCEEVEEEKNIKPAKQRSPAPPAGTTLSLMVPSLSHQLSYEEEELEKED